MVNTHARRLKNFVFFGFAFLATSPLALAMDPCGMVPPIYLGKGSPIARVGLQQTYVFLDNGVESFVIRPGFTGKVDNFGMLIPFPNPPAIRKVPDNVFEHIEKAIDPPEVVVDVRRRKFVMGGGGFGGGGLGGGGGVFGGPAPEDRLEVLNEEAVGMYEVAVLSAGSAKALKKWMDQNKYQYPDGMDNVTNDYVKEGWCFVAVKTRVAPKAGADPKPGQREADPRMEPGSLFDGAVQALGFRFPSEELVVPMRLSAFNEGEMRNIVYLLTKGGKRIRSIPEEYVVRQVSGKQLIKNLTLPVPLRIIGGTERDIDQRRRRSIAEQRKPGQYNGNAFDLFASDVKASGQFRKSGDLNLRYEIYEKELLAIGEHFGLRGEEIDKQIASVVKKPKARLAEETRRRMRVLTLTVVDGDFPRDVVARENLRFDSFRMAASRNSAKVYDAKEHGPAPVREGRLFSGVDPWKYEQQNQTQQVSQTADAPPIVAAVGAFGLLFFAWPIARLSSSSKKTERGS